MSTRSNIAIELPKDKDGNKKVKVIYVHSDGYPYGVGKILVDNYNKRDVAELLFNHGDASYLGDTIDECSFYGRDWDRDEDPAKTYRDEWMYMNHIKGDVFIEYIYLFKDNRWHVSTQKSTKTKDGYDDGTLFYYTKFEPVSLNQEYIKYKDKHEKNAEVKMISQIGNLLSKAGFDQDNIEIQGGAVKKKSN
jgi:hypothetical protein